jgi:thiamine biosynthesis lipoprotein
MDWFEHTQRSMGGHLGIRVVFAEAVDAAAGPSVRELLRSIGARVDAWASLMTRHHPSQLTRLNAASGAEVSVGPTLASLLSWSADAWEETGGLVNIAMLDERIAAETGVTVRGQGSSRGWQLELRHWRHEDHAHLRGGLLRRPEGLHLDLDGVGKGWIADRAVALLVRLLDARGAVGEIPRWTSCFVDGDGDIALRHRDGAETEIRIEIPREVEATIGTIRVSGPTAGVATSGTGVHRWGGRHHLIDPQTSAPADSGIAQATVVAESAREAEAWAKSIVIGGAALIRRAEAAGIQRIVAVQTHGGIVSAPALDRPDARHRFTPVDSRRFDATVPAR